MKKVKGKALSLVLSLALVISSFSAIPAAASTKTLSGSLGGDYTTKFYLVSGGSGNGLVLANFGTAVSDNATMTTDHHKSVDGVKISAISRKSGDNLVKWYDAADNKDSIDSDTEDANIALELRNSSVSGTETLSLLYKGTYTDDNDKEYTVRAVKDVTIRVYDKGEVVLGKQSNDGESGCKGELDSDFSQKTVTHETTTGPDNKKISTNTDSKKLTALKAVNDGTDPIVKWEALPTTSDSTKLNVASSGYDYYLKCSSPSNISLGATDENQEGATVSAGIETAGISMTGDTTNSVTINKVLSDGADVKYAYTTDGSTPELKADAAAATKKDNTNTTVAASTDFTLTVPADNLTVVGFADIGTSDAHNWVAVTKPIVVKYVYNKDTATSCTIDGKNGVVTDAAGFVPQLTADGTTIGKVTITPCATPNYFYKFTNDGAKDSAWTKWDGSAKVNAPTPAVESGHSYSIQVVTVPSTVTTSAAVDAAILGTATGTWTKAISEDDGYVTARVKDKASTASFTFTLQATQFLKTAQTGLTNDNPAKISSLTDVKQKAKITKTILVDDSAFAKIGKYKTTTYLYKGTLDGDTTNAEKVNVGGFEVKFDVPAAVTVTDKASVKTIDGKLTNITVDESSNVDEISSDDLTAVSVSDSTVDKISAKNAKVTVDSVKANVGEIAKSKTVEVSDGKVGNITASDSVNVTPDDDEHSVTVGNVTTKDITIDSNESLGVTAGTLKATDDDSEFTVSGNDVTIGGVDFDYYGAELKIDGFIGSVPAPKNADAGVEGATISTQQADDKVTIKGDADINSISLADESTMIFDGKLNVGSVDGSGKLVVGLGKMNVTSDASDVKLQLADNNFKVGDVAYTSDHDTIDADSFGNYGFTVTKSEGSKTDTFKIATTKFVGMAFADSSAELAEGASKTFTANNYAPGSALPTGYKVKYTFDGDDTVFAFTDNSDGTATVKAVKIDPTFASLNKGKLKAEIVDADGATNDDYDAGEVDITATTTPAVTYKSDTTGALSIKQGGTYQYKITSLDGSVPTMAVGSAGFKVTAVGASGSDYFFKVQATGVVGTQAGVYINHEAKASSVITITNGYKIDTTKVTMTAGKTYQFKVSGATQPTFQVAGIGNVALTSKSGTDYFFKVTVPATLAKGAHGVYVNGAKMAAITVA